MYARLQELHLGLALLPSGERSRGGTDLSPRSQPNVAEAYRKKVENLQAALRDPANT
jgi:hypothetical protein